MYGAVLCVVFVKAAGCLSSALPSYALGASCAPLLTKSASRRNCRHFPGPDLEASALPCPSPLFWLWQNDWLGEGSCCPASCGEDNSSPSRAPHRQTGLPCLQSALLWVTPDPQPYLLKDWFMCKPAIHNSIQLSCVSGRDRRIWPSTVFPGEVSGNRIGSGAART